MSLKRAHDGAEPCNLLMESRAVASGDVLVDLSPADEADYLAVVATDGPPPDDDALGLRMHPQNPHNPRSEDSGDRFRGSAPATGAGSEDSGDAIREWRSSAPVPLDAAPAPLPTDTLGPVLGPLAEAMAEAYQVPADLVINQALPLITTAIAGRTTVEITPDWTETIALATLSALASGERKSPVQRVLADPLVKHERNARDDTQRRTAEQQARRQVAEDRAEKLRRHAAKTGTTEDERQYIAAREALAELSVDPEPRWLVDDITPEALAPLLAAHQAIGAVSAEPGLFSILAGRYSNGTPNVETVLKATSGDPITVDRVGRDPVHVDRPALSIAMCIQPARLPELGGRGTVFRGSGLLARLLYVLPEPRVGSRAITPPTLSPDVFARWKEHLTKLVAADQLTPVLTLDTAAQEQLHDFREWLEPQLHPHHGRLAGFADWGSKLPGTVARIAGALALLTDPDRDSVDGDTMSDAIRLGHAYISHTAAAFEVIHRADPGKSHAREVLGWLVKRGETTFSRRDVYQGIRRRAWVTGSDALAAPLDELVDLGHLWRIVEDRAGKPGRPSERFELHRTHLAHTRAVADGDPRRTAELEARARRDPASGTAPRTAPQVGEVTEVNARTHNGRASD